MKEKKCKECFKPAGQFLKGLCPGCYKKLQKEKEKIKQQKVKQKRELNTLTVPKVAVLIQKLCRLTGTDYCVSCGESTPLYHGGHWRSRRYHATVFYLKNIHNQCPNCNIFLSGNEYLHGKYIESEYGLETADQLLKMSRQPYRWTKEELKEIKEQALAHIALVGTMPKEEIRKSFIEWQESTEWFKKVNDGTD